MRLPGSNFQDTSFRRERGFSLVEFVIAGSIFLVLTGIVAVMFISSFGGQRKVIAAQHVSDNGRYILDAIAKEVRVSKICGDADGSDPTPEGACIDPVNNTFTNTTSTRLNIVRSVPPYELISYCITGGTIKRLTNSFLGFLWDACTDPGSRVLNDPGVFIDSAGSSFIISGIGQSPPASGPCRPAGAAPLLDVCQPRVTITLRVVSKTHKAETEKVETSIQTTLSQRFIDFP